MKSTNLKDTEQKQKKVTLKYGCRCSVSKHKPAFIIGYIKLENKINRFLRMCGLCIYLLCLSSPSPSLHSLPSTGRWRLYCQKTITLTDVIYLPIISIIHITLVSSLFLCPSPSPPLPFPPNFFLLLHSAQFLPPPHPPTPSLILALSPLLSPTFHVTGLVDEKQLGENSWPHSNAVSVSRLADEDTQTHTHTLQYEQTVIVIK